MKNRNGQGNAPRSIESGYATAGVPVSGGPVVSEIIPIPEALGDWIRGSKFQPILLKVKEQTGINYFTLNKDPKTDSMQLWIYSPTPDRAKMARLLVDVNFKQQLKLAQAEQNLLQMQSDLTSVQSEVVSGLRVEFQAPQELIGLMIGKGGARIQEVIRRTGVKSINMNDSGKVIIVGTDATNAQEARGMFELLEDASPLNEEQHNQLLRDYTALNDLKSSTGLLVARLERNPFRITYIGTRSAIDCAKVVLVTQLEYLQKRLALLSDEMQIRQELSSYRGGGGGRGGRGGRGVHGDSLSRVAGRGGAPRARPADAPAVRTSYGESRASARTVEDKPAGPMPTRVSTRSTPAKDKANGRGPSLRDSLQQMEVSTNGKVTSQPVERPTTASAPASSRTTKKSTAAAAENSDAPAPAVAETKKKPKAKPKAAATEEVSAKVDSPAPAPAARSSRRRRGDAAAETQDSLVSAFESMAVSTEGISAKPKPKAKAVKPAPVAAAVPAETAPQVEAEPLPRRTTRARAKKTEASQDV